MAQEDYLSGSQFGQVAGSLLASRRKSDKKGFRKALLASVILESFGAGQKMLKQSIVDGVNGVNEKYTDIFAENEELFQNAKGNRDKFQEYTNDPEAYLNKAAKDLFNADPGIQKEMGFNAYNRINKDVLTPEAYSKAMGIYNGYKQQAEYNIKKLGINPAVSMSTFTRFNEKATKAYRAAVSEFEDDPTKKGVLRAAFNKIFGTDFNGNKRFGMAERAELIGDREETERLRLDQEDITTGKVVPPEEIEKLKNNWTRYQNDEANNIINFMIGTDYELPFPSRVATSSFELETNAEMIKIKKDSFIEKVNQKDYAITEDDIHQAVQLETKIPGFPGLASLMNSQRPELILISAKVKAAVANGQNIWDAGVLNDNERNIWSKATSRSLDAMQSNSIELSNSLKKAAKIDTVPFTEVTKHHEDTDVLASVKNVIKVNYENNDSLKELYNNGLITEDTIKDVEMHVIEAALDLKLRTGMGLLDAIRKVTPVQMRGFYKFQEDTGWFNNETHRHEYVDANVFRRVQTDVKTAEDAEILVQYMNTKRYVQNLPLGDDKDGDTLTPDRLGKNYTDGDYKFSVININADKILDNGEDAPQKLWWQYEYIGN